MQLKSFDIHFLLFADYIAVVALYKLVIYLVLISLLLHHMSIWCRCWLLSIYLFWYKWCSQVVSTSTFWIESIFLFWYIWCRCWLVCIFLFWSIWCSCWLITIFLFCSIWCRCRCSWVVTIFLFWSIWCRCRCSWLVTVFLFWSIWCRCRCSWFVSIFLILVISGRRWRLISIVTITLIFCLDKQEFTSFLHLA